MQAQAFAGLPAGQLDHPANTCLRRSHRLYSCAPAQPAGSCRSLYSSASEATCGNCVRSASGAKLCLLQGNTPDRSRTHPDQRQLSPCPIEPGRFTSPQAFSSASLHWAPSGSQPSHWTSPRITTPILPSSRTGSSGLLEVALRLQVSEVCQAFDHSAKVRVHQAILTAVGIGRRTVGDIAAALTIRPASK